MTIEPSGAKMDDEAEDRIVAKLTRKIFELFLAFCLAAGLWRFYGFFGVVLGFGAFWAVDAFFARPDKSKVREVEKSAPGPGIIPSREEAREKRNKRRLEDKLKLGQ
jgi:hypothetical protein